MCSVGDCCCSHNDHRSPGPRSHNLPGLLGDRKTYLPHCSYFHETVVALRRRCTRTLQGQPRSLCHHCSQLGSAGEPLVLAAAARMVLASCKFK